jgi:hypothetical protein
LSGVLIRPLIGPGWYGEYNPGGSGCGLSARPQGAPQAAAEDGLHASVISAEAVSIAAIRTDRREACDRPKKRIVGFMINSVLLAGSGLCL